MASDPVARVQSISTAEGSIQISGGYSPGVFYPLLAGTPDAPGGPPAKVPAVVIRDGRFAVAVVDMPLQIRDLIKTSPDTVMAIEFLIGGRVGINQDTAVEIVSERSVADGSNGWWRVFMKNVSLWMKADAKALKQPLEIQTNGGVMGIKG